jgi:hypothetical protein
LAINLASAQSGHPAPSPPPPGAKSIKCSGRPVPQLEDVTAASGITFTHTSDQSKRYIVESMSGGVLLIDYDRDGWQDIYFTNAPTVEMATKGNKSLGVLYHNNHDGTFTDVTAKSGLTTPRFGMGGALGDYNNSGRPSISVTNFSDENDLLYHNEGDWNFKEVSYSSGIALPSLPWVKWRTALVDVDNDGCVDLIAVSGHVYPQVNSLPSGGGYREHKLLNLNQKIGTFCDASDGAGQAMKERRVSRGLAIGDLFNDGNMDIVVGDIDGAPHASSQSRHTGTSLGQRPASWNKEQSARVERRISIVAGG